MRHKIAVVFGGCSSEHWVSLQSATVVRNLDPEKYHPIMMGITRQGEWLHYAGPVEQIAEDSWYTHESCSPALLSLSRTSKGFYLFSGNQPLRLAVDLVFPVLHGKNGEDGTLQGLLDMAGIPYTGCGTLSSTLGMDKDLAHTLAKAAGIKVLCSEVVRKTDELKSVIKRAEPLGWPVMVKPARPGSSLGITLANSRNELEEALESAFQHDCKVVIEEYVEGFEVGCAILGNRQLTIGDIDEVELNHSWFDYQEKYTQTNSKIHVPARITQEVAAQIRNTAVNLYRTLGCKGFARVDMFLTPQGELVFNELNTIPGLTAKSRFPRMLAGIGMSFSQVLDQIIVLALEHANDSPN
jgi:D-alanine---D-serine ligase